jgi:hypothetical protein
VGGGQSQSRVFVTRQFVIRGEILLVSPTARPTRYQRCAFAAVDAKRHLCIQTLGMFLGYDLASTEEYVTMENSNSATSTEIAGNGNDITTTKNGSASPKIHETSDANSFPLNLSSSYKIRRRPLPAILNDHNDTGDRFAEPLLTDRQRNADQELWQVSTASIIKRVRRRLGLLTLAILVLGTITILAALGFLSFLWFSNARNRDWRIIATKNWMTRAVSLTALAIRTAVSLQAIAATSMLAGLTLEKGSVLMTELAAVSTMRNTNSGPLRLAWVTSKALLKTNRPWRQILLPSLLAALTITTLLIQFSSTALLADLSLSPTQGLAYAANLSNHFVYDSAKTPALNQTIRGSAWLRVPAFNPIFAEFSEAGTNTDPAIVDTGRKLRAFLPLQEQQARYNIQDYKGVATILDSRVICVRPELRTPEIHMDGLEAMGNDGAGRWALVTSVTASAHVPGVVGSQSEGYDSVRFGCLMDTQQSLADVWRISLCQINQNEGLPSEFETTTSFQPNSNSGAQYLVLNVSSGTLEDWSQVTHIDFNDNTGVIQPPFSSAFPPVREEGNGEWLDLFFQDDSAARLSVSLCYAAFDSADLDIHAFSSTNRTESVGSFDAKTSVYRYDSLRQQLGQTKNGSWIEGMSEQRGILELASRPDWRPGSQPGDYIRPMTPKDKDSDEPYISFLLNGAKFEGTSPFEFSDPNVGWLQPNWTAVLDFERGGVLSDSAVSSGYAVSDIYPDPSFSSLLQDILQNGGDIAHAVSSLITVVSGSTYYDQLGQFNGIGNTTQTMFVSVLTPQHRRGYVAVLVVTLLHLQLAGMCLLLFLMRTKVSSIGNSWQTLAQVKDPRTGRLLDLGTLATDGEVESWMMENASSEAVGHELDVIGNSGYDAAKLVPIKVWRPDDLVGVKLAGNGKRTELFSRRRSVDSVADSVVEA